MLKIERILFPIGFEHPSQHIAQQAAWLARRFNAEIILLHVVSPLFYPAGVLESGHQITARDLHAHAVEQAQKNLDQALPEELAGIAVTRQLVRGHPAQEIVQAALDHRADLIVMASHDRGVLYPLLLGSVTAKVLHETECPVWTGSHLEELPERDFSIRRMLCSVDFNPHSSHTLALAVELLAAAVGAALTLVHITSSVETFGPGGMRVDTEWQEKIVGGATAEIARLQQHAGSSAPVIIHSGKVTEQLNQAADETNADVLVIGHTPGRSHLGDNGNGYGIIRASKIPVLSV